MRTGRIVALSAVFVIGLSMAVVAGEAGGPQAPAKEITIDGKKPARFDHQKHMAVAGVSCGQCHHDAAHQPLSAEAIAALPKARSILCVSCHNEGFAKETLRQRKDIFHANCKECHTAGVGGKKGPTKCIDCHLK